MSASSKVQKLNGSSFVSNHAKNIAPSGIRKFFDLLSGMEGVIHSASGNPMPSEITPSIPG